MIYTQMVTTSDIPYMGEISEDYYLVSLISLP